ncbi:hypothetical protein COY25_04310 [Candidatus Uhrbacteria bacterium CG_4_10_14_0_2_um_filter_41_7]|uniref:Uncharacterized protein n=1 Tax=Candidatus Uhrbacteria bacterium CG_4_9_14_3_um_filter_41_35 TaxID=1975034 RepID=A0A2M7XFR4_9BACT|nr:MAG: hypothetical protein COV92_00835 [Candidatus Uhrbacteria bacterium CG11_big_fil_rev_8_21_14_0_20_41_9]PIZ53012.1 MAG: hypothetical protein COY25_04310 [Candidatus Uhrbacteria bacterium CG_4_10_14_0_2_um_filter_41_7]PJA46702.1 MAG: hypothetical protein CO173_02965 [Candidatus Uhrbacteria bacterium CG_4_9_14_3_um_filter_41_35]
MTACSVQTTINDEIESNIETSNNTYVLDLSWRYLELEVTDEEAVDINDEVRNLDPNELRSFMDELMRLQGADVDNTYIANVVVEEAIKQGIAPFDLDVQVVYDALEGDLYRSCLPGQSTCTVWSPAYQTSLYGGSCGYGCTSGTWMDRQSTGACEWGGCDHRFHFPTANKTTIDGKTTAYDNWINSYSSILGEHWSGSTYAVLGHGQMLLSGIFVPSASKLQVY